jgi:two-component system CheB/CheR fusion protein
MKAPSVTNDTADSSATEAQILAEAIIDTVRESLLVLHADLRVKSANHSFYESFQTDRADTEGRLVYELGGGQWNIPALRRLLSDILPNNGDLQGFEVDHTFATVGRRVMLLNARRIDHLQLVLLAIEDITERRRAEERQKLMMAELGHRMKNLLTIIQSIFELAAASSPSIEALRTAFPGRLHALVRTHDSLMKQEWAGTDLYELVRQESAPYDQDGGRVELDGPPVTLDHSASLPVALLLHELASNAAKYGALSVPQGRVSVRWATDDGSGGRWVRLHWTERDGPPPRPAPGRGFGTTLIERSIAYELGGETALNFAAAGVECDVRFPLRRESS